MKKNEFNSSNMPPQNKRLFDLVNEKANGNVSQFASMIGVKQQVLDRVFKRDKRSGKFPSISQAIKDGLKEKLGIDEVYLLVGGDVSGDGNSFGSGTVNNDNKTYYRGCGGADEKAAQNILDLQNRMDAQENKPTISYTHGKPYYNVDFLGGFDIILNDQTINPEYLIDFKKYADADCWCNISGHSMEPLISNGDIIAIKQINDWREFLLYGEAYGIVTNDMRTVKIVTKSDKGDDYIRLIPVNKSGEYQPQDLPKKLITHVFRVLGCMKKL
jgi:hypothetical protein|nr:MAG TPA: hypothetical protein [Caudoviricetes sp.]